MSEQPEAPDPGVTCVVMCKRCGEFFPVTYGAVVQGIERHREEKHAAAGEAG